MGWWHLRLELHRLRADVRNGAWSLPRRPTHHAQVFGATTLQPAALPDGATSVVYVPDLHASGADSFAYQSTDCPGDLFRFSSEATVAVDLTPVNDAPYAGTSHFQVNSTIIILNYIELYRIHIGHLALPDAHG